MRYFFSVLTAICIAAITVTSHAGDLDDGIGFDKSINDDLKKETNFQYITMKAKARSAINTKKLGAAKGQAAGIGNINFGAGTRIKNVTIINNSNNKGAAAVGGR